MKKASAREFRNHFGRLTASLKPGEHIQVSKSGKVHGIYQRVAHAKVKQPDFLGRAEKHPYPEAVGAALLKRLDEALS